MKAKMKFNEANGFALLHMIGRSEDMGIECDTAILSAYAGVSKTATLPRLWKLLEVGYIECHVEAYRPNSERYVFMLTKYGRDVYHNGRFERYYKSWVAMSQHVTAIRSNSTKSMFV